MKKYAFAAVLIAFAACATAKHAANGKPDWINNWKSQYPEEMYLAGVGVADNRASAEDFARGEIAKVFTAQVNVSENASSSESDTDNGSKTTSSVSQSASMNVKTISKKVLQGVEIEADWQDPATAQFYALAVLDRQKAGSSLSAQIADIDGQSQALLSGMNTATGKFAKAKDAMKILSLLKTRDALNTDLRIISANSTAQASPIDEGSFRAQAQGIMSSLNVSVTLNGDGSSDVQAGLIAGLGSLGIQAKDSSDTSTAVDIAISGDITTTSVTMGAGSPWMRAASKATINVKDMLSSNTIVDFIASTRADATDLGVASQRSRAALADQVSQRIQDELSNYFSNR